MPAPRASLAFAVFACVEISPTRTVPLTVDEGSLARQKEPAKPEAAGPNTILDLQPFRQTSSNRIRSGKGMQGTAKLVNLNPAVNAWYVLEVNWQGGSKSFYHLENPKPRSQKLLLDPKYSSGIDIVEGNAHHLCDLF